MDATLLRERKKRLEMADPGRKINIKRVLFFYFYFFYKKSFRQNVDHTTSLQMFFQLTTKGEKVVMNET